MKNNKHKKIHRDDRISQLGGFGSKRTQVVPDKKTKYNRKSKHKSPRDDSGAYFFIDKVKTFCYI